jgi:ribonuclease J
MSSNTQPRGLHVIVHRGTQQIGGSCIEVASSTTRLILDCGWPLEGDHNSTPPSVPGLFAPGQPPNALLLSHAHPDHTGFIDQIPETIPIYATVATSKIMHVGSCYTKKGVKLPRNSFRELPIPNACELCTRITIGGIAVTSYSVDHSAYGAVGFLIEHADKRVFYTGDLRFHGRKWGMAEKITRDLAGRVDLLIAEGTNLGRTFTGLKREGDVEEEAFNVSRTSQSLVMVSFSPQNVDRFISFYRCAQRSGRTLVCDHYTAAVLYMVNRPSVPKPGRAKDLRVFFPSQRKVIEKFERHSRCAAIELEEVLSEPAKYLMLVRPTILEHDFGDRIPAGSVLLYGLWSGYRKDEKVNAAERRITAKGGRVQECHASGHAHESDLMDFIKALQPARVLPVHTLHSDHFARFGFSCVQACDGLSIRI